MKHKRPPQKPERLPTCGMDAVIAKAGGGAALARASGVTRFAVQMWKDTGIPAARVPAVSRATGLSLHDLRPDLFDAPAAAAPRQPAPSQPATA